MRKYFRYLGPVITILLTWGMVNGVAQISIPNTFSPKTTIQSSQVNANFTVLGSNALNRTGGTMTGELTFSSGHFIILTGAGSGTLSLKAASAAGSGSILTFPGGTTDFSASGGAHKVVFQTSAGGVFTVAQPAIADLSDGSNIGLLNANNTWAAREDFLTYSETKTSPTVGSTTTLDLSLSSHFTITLSTDITTLNITNAPVSGRAASFVLTITANGTPHSITWPGSVKFPSGAAPTLTSTNGKIDVISFLSYDGGTSWLAFVDGQSF